MTTAPDLDLVAALRGSRLFAELPDEEVAALAETSRSVDLAPGEVLMREGSPPDAMYVVTDGELEVSRHANGADLLLNVCGPGDLIGELGVAHGRPRSATVRARGPVRVQRIGAEALDTLLSHPTAARALLTATTRRLDREEGLLRQHERMAALGALAAGLLHEVNNPASAVQRGASRLKALLAGEDAGQPAARPGRGAAGARGPARPGGRRAAVAGALTAGGVEGGWSAAADLVRLGVEPGALARALAGLPEDQRGPAVPRPGPRRGGPRRARGGGGRRRLPVEDRVRGAPAGLRRRPVADRGRHPRRAGAGARAGAPQGAARRAGRARPRPAAADVEGWAADLAMVWTNLLDNALAAVGQEGEVTVRTRGEPDTVVVDVENTGPTVPPEVLARVFDAFYTTKPIGQGTGLGLATSLAVVAQRHKGTLTLTSADGVTRARVVLPRHR